MGEVISIDEGFLEMNRDIPQTLGDTAQQIPGAPPPIPGPMQPAPGYILTAETLELTFGVLFDFIAMGIGDGGEFWQLRPFEKQNLAKAWLPVLGPLLDAWGASGNMPLILACGMTAMTLGPRLARDAKRRADAKATAATVSSGDLPSSPAPPAAESQSKPIDWLEELNAA